MGSLLAAVTSGGFRVRSGFRWRSRYIESYVCPQHAAIMQRCSSLTMSTSDMELMVDTYIVIPTSTGGPATTSDTVRPSRTILARRLRKFDFTSVFPPRLSPFHARNIMITSQCLVTPQRPMLRDRYGYYYRINLFFTQTARDRCRRISIRVRIMSQATVRV